MPRRRRKDHPGAWWHIMNRGVAQRTLFTCPREYRYFLLLLALAVRMGWIEVHAFCLMDNHFHLLIRSPHGSLSRAMQWIEDSYARWFNLRHERDGPLFRGRFTSVWIESIAVRRGVIGYVHGNPDHHKSDTPSARYPWSSARAYIRGKGRPWLSRQFGERLPLPVLIGKAVPFDLIEAILADGRPDHPDLDHLVVARPAGIQRWLQARVRRADGVVPTRRLLRADTLGEIVEEARAKEPSRIVRPGRRRRNAWDLVLAGLYRGVCALPYDEVATRLGVSVSTAHARVRAHEQCLRVDDAYANLCSRLMRAGLDRDYGDWAV